MNHPNETSLYNVGDTAIRINSETDHTANPSTEPRTSDVTSTAQQYTINIDANTPANSDSSTVQQNLLSFLNEARSHLGGRPVNLQTAAASGEHVHQHTSLQADDSNVNRWRVNLNNVLSFSAGPSTETIRSWIPRTGTFRYVPIRRASSVSSARDTSAAAPNEAAIASDVIINLNTSTAPERSESSPAGREPRPAATARISLSRANSVGFAAVTPIVIAGSEINTEPTTPPIQPSTSNGGPRTPSTPPPRNTADVDEDNVVYEVAVKVLSHFVRYLPFIGIVLIKSIYDHWLGIVDILVLHTVVYHINKSLCEQVASLSHRNPYLLLRDFALVTFFVIYRFFITQSRPDWFGLLINTADDPHSLGQLLHAVAVNDLILKLITINIKIIVTALPLNIIKHKPRGRLFALIEAMSQMYRSLVPIKSWLLYLVVSYTGVDFFVGTFFFSSLYMGAKIFEFVERGKFLKKSFCNFLRNVEYGRQPTKVELSDANALCPICHDSYDTPVVLECNHIFCEVCVGTWFKREQTCPMCRAKVADDPAWHNGSTTLFYQLC